MDVSDLHAVTEDLAAHLSEVTQADLDTPISGDAGDIGGLYLHLVRNNLRVAAVVAGTPAVSAGHEPTPNLARTNGFPNLYGGGLENEYRRTAWQLETAFAGAMGASRCRLAGAEVDVATLYDQQISAAVVHTWDIADALDLPYRPAAQVIYRVLNTVQSRRSNPFGEPSDQVAFECVLRMSGRLQKV